MVTKKEMLILGAVAVGGLGLASMLAGGEEEEGGGFGIPRFGGLSSVGTHAPVAPSIYNFPPEIPPVFPQPAPFDWDRFFPSTITAKKTATEMAGFGKITGYAEDSIALGYEGYVTPTTPTPFKKRNSGGGGYSRSTYGSTPSASKTVTTPSSKKGLHSGAAHYGTTESGQIGGWD